MEGNSKLASKDVEDILALSSMQEGILYQCLLNPADNLYLIQISLTLSGRVQSQAIRKAWNFVIQTNEMLRTVFRWEKLQKPVQIVLRDQSVDLREFDLSTVQDQAQRQEKRMQLKVQDQQEQFDLSQGSLIRVTLIKLSEEEYEMIVTNHHILYDGWSNGVIFSEFFTAYQHFSNGKIPTLEKKVKFKEYLKHLHQQEEPELLTYWANYLQDCPEKTPLPFDRDIFGETQPHGVQQVYECSCPVALTTMLQQKCRAEKITPSVILYAGWGLLLHKYTGSRDLLFGVPVSGRSGNLQGVERMVGLFINTLPLRVQISPGQTVSYLWGQIHHTLQEWEKYATLPLWKIQSTQPNLSGSLFDSLVVVENYPLELNWQGTLGAVKVSEYSVHEKNNFPLVLEIRTFGELELKVSYDGDLFKQETIEGIVTDYLRMIQEMMSNSQENVAALSWDLPKPLLMTKPVSKKLPREQNSYEAPGNQIEKRLVDIWAKVFNKKRIGVNDDFYELGGHSLKAMQIISLIHKQMDVKISLSKFYQHPTVAGIARLVSLHEQEGYAEILAQPDGTSYPLSYTQKRLWLINQLEPDRSSAYHISGRKIFYKKVQVDLILQVLQKLVTRHASLRTSFPSEAGQPVQIVHPSQVVTLEVADLSAISEEQRENLREEIFAQESEKPFDLAQLPLFRARLLKLTEGESELIFTMHHIISDGWSMEILQREFQLYYQGLEERSDFDLSPLPIQYKDFTLWQKQLLADAQRSEEPRQYWRNLLTGELPVLNLPADYPLSEGERRETAAYKLYISKEMHQRLVQLAGERHVSLFALLLTGFNILLADYTGQEDLLIGIPAAGRSHVELEKVIGFFVNTVILRNLIEPTQSVDMFIQQVASQLVTAMEYQHYPVELVCQELKINYPRIRAFVNMLNIGEKERLPEDDRPEHCAKVREGKFDLTIYLTEYVDGIEVDCHYHAGLFEPKTIEFLMGEYQRILDELACDPSRRVQEYWRRPLQDDLVNGDVAESCGQQRIEDLFLEIVEKYPDRLAVKGLEESLTYRQLDRYAERVVSEICEQRKNSSTVMILLFDHGIEMIIGIIAALKAGMTYVPVDSNLPYDRLSYILQDSQAGLMLTNERSRWLAEKVIQKGDEHAVEKVINVSEITDEKEIQSQSGGQEVMGVRRVDEPAYILYTSGSTGKPKGVVQSQRNILHFIKNYVADLNITWNDRLTLFSALGHDAAVMDIYSALLSGATLYPLNIKDQVNISELVTWLKQEKITIYHSVPTVYRYLVKGLSEPAGLTDLRYIVLGGEQVVEYDLEIFQRYFGSGTTLVNLYGQSESSYNSSLFINQGESLPRTTLGHPVEDTAILVVNEAGERVGPLKSGEIVIASEHVALGYWNDPVKTESVFGKSPQWGRFYRTGDVGKVLLDGQIEFVGRKDFQVKIRGYRVELGEIESHLLTHSAIRQAVVVAQNRGDVGTFDSLTGYLVPKDGQRKVDLKELKKYLQSRLPDYMIPADFVILEKMPLTSTNKIDRQTLAELKLVKALKRRELAPQVTNDLEFKLLRIWANLLHRQEDEISLTESFFDQGGNSLLVMDLATQINQQLQVEVKITDLFKYSTISEMSEFIHNLIIDGADSSLISGLKAERTRSGVESRQEIAPYRKPDPLKINQVSAKQNRKIRKFSLKQEVM